MTRPLRHMRRAIVTRERRRQRPPAACFPQHVVSRSQQFDVTRLLEGYRCASAERGRGGASVYVEFVGMSRAWGQNSRTLRDFRLFLVCTCRVRVDVSETSPDRPPPAPRGLGTGLCLSHHAHGHVDMLEKIHIIPGRHPDYVALHAPSWLLPACCIVHAQCGTRVAAAVPRALPGVIQPYRTRVSHCLNSSPCMHFGFLHPSPFTMLVCVRARAPPPPPPHHAFRFLDEEPFCLPAALLGFWPPLAGPTSSRSAERSAGIWWD